MRVQHEPRSLKFSRESPFEEARGRLQAYLAHAHCGIRPEGTAVPLRAAF